MTRFVLMIPSGAVTGGPECMHQLSDALLRLGHDAHVWYVDRRQARVLDGHTQKRQTILGSRLNFGTPTPPPDEYAHYRVRPCTGPWTIDRDTVFVIPEVFVQWTPIFAGTRLVIWWLSVDNGLAALGTVNLNGLRRQGIFNVTQSRYAAGFVRALGLTLAGPLYDYTPLDPPPQAMQSTDGPARVAINGRPGKVRIDPHALQAVIEARTGLQAQVIAGLTREQVYALLGASSVYVDLGTFPGKDRMPREAMLRDCIPLLRQAGAAACGDFDLPAVCLLEDEEDFEAIAARCHTLVRERAALLAQIAPARHALRREREVFDGQVQALTAMV